MRMLDWDKVWARVSRLDIFRGMKQTDFRYSGIGKTFTLSSGQTSPETPVDFPALSIILGIRAGVAASAQDGVTIERGLQMTSWTLAYPGGQGNIITNGPLNGAAIFGANGDGFPPGEVIIGANGTLNVTVKNLSTSTILPDICFHSMICKLNAA